MKPSMQLFCFSAFFLFQPKARFSQFSLARRTTRERDLGLLIVSRSRGAHANLGTLHGVSKNRKIRKTEGCLKGFLWMIKASGDGLLTL